MDTKIAVKMQRHENKNAIFRIGFNPPHTIDQTSISKLQKHVVEKYEI
jgi:hypothetical protein